MIKVFITDVDSTLTDGIYRMSEDGVVSKSFFTRDFHGLWMLNESGVKVCIISYSRDKVINLQCERAAKYVYLMTGVKNKLEYVRDQVVQGNLFGQQFAWDELAYIADDVFDMDLLLAVGIAACPADAHEEVLQNLSVRKDGFLCTANGGRGAVREFADYILDLNRRDG